MNDEYASLLANYEGHMANHVRTVVVETDTVRCYRFGAPGTRMWSFQVTETPEGLHICGDVPQEPLTVRETLGWFLGATSQKYMASRVGLQKAWDWKAARDALQDEAATLEACELSDADAAHAAKLREVADEIREPDHEMLGAFALNDALTDIGYDTSDGLPGYRYPPETLAMLEAIRRTVVRCGGQG